MESSDKKSKNANRVFYMILVLLIIGSVGVTFFKIVIKKDYQILAETSCDPKTEKCFARTCDPTSDSTCPAIEADRTTYYKIISKNASSIALCEATTDKIGCDTELSCTSNEISCSYTYCNPDELIDGEVCAYK